MRVLFERTGGFAGMRLTATIDTESMCQKDARELTDMVHAAGFFDLTAVTPAAASGADRFQYKITVSDGSREHSVEVVEPGASEGLSVLLQRLSSLARSGRGS